MTSVSKSRRFEVLARDGFRCRYCGAQPTTVELHVDHVVPRSRGGSDAMDNLVAACLPCNFGKSDRALIPSVGGFSLTPDQRPSRMAKMRRSKRASAVDPNVHVLSTGDIDSLDEIDEYDQLALVWCESHQKYEWHNLPQDLIGVSYQLTRVTKPGWRGAI